MEDRNERGCLICGEDARRELSPERIAKLAMQISAAPSLLADTGVYKNRIALCETCEALREEVLCSYCGCFIFFRARPAKSHCPHPKGNKWRSDIA